MDKPIKVDVELQFVGNPIGKKDGGIFTTLVRQVRVECLPNKIPEVITMNVDNLRAGESLHVSDIKTDGFKMVTSSKIALCQVSQVKEDTDVAAAPVAAPAAKK